MKCYSREEDKRDNFEDLFDKLQSFSVDEFRDYLSKLISPPLYSDGGQANLLQELSAEFFEKMLENLDNLKRKTFSVVLESFFENWEVDVQELKNRSNNLPYSSSFPNLENRIERFPEHEICSHATNTYPICHSRVRTLVREFYQFKCEFGTDLEKSVYQNLHTEGHAFDRFLKKRPLVFMGSHDYYMLQDNSGSCGGFTRIHEVSEREGVSLDKYMSYDEMMISATMGVSVPTHFINSGDRDNLGRIYPEGSFIPKGIYVGLVGCRFEKSQFMECRTVLVSKSQNTSENGYGRYADENSPSTKFIRMWAKCLNQRGTHDSPMDDLFYLPSYEEVLVCKKKENFFLFGE